MGFIQAGSKENDRPSDNKIGSRECDRATGNKIRAPDVKKVVGTYDPNYQTLVGLSNDEVFKPKVRRIRHRFFSFFFLFFGFFLSCN